jgi:hypothetical protein
MKVINFMDLGDGTHFRIKQADDSYIEYVKIPEERVSCCKVFNAVLAADHGQKHQIMPLTQIETEYND